MKGILMKGPMAQGAFDGRKTWTRRILKPQPRITTGVSGIYRDVWLWKREAPLRKLGYSAGYIHTSASVARNIICDCAPYKPGELVYIKETWRPFGDRPLSQCTDQGDISFRASLSEEDAAVFKWRSPLIMPQWAARSVIRIKEVHLDRPQDLSEEQILKEGITVDMVARVTGTSWLSMPDLRTAWKVFWIWINGQASWDANPLVYAYNFELAAPVKKQNAAPG